EGEHLAADVEDGDFRSRRSVEGALPTSSGGEAKDSVVGDRFAEPPQRVDRLQWVGEFVILRRTGERRLLASKPVPGLGVLGFEALAAGIHLTIMSTAVPQPKRRRSQAAYQPSPAQG